jgi:hypothetical protein
MEVSMKTIESKLETLSDILNPLLTNASPQKKRYAKDLFTEIIGELNKNEYLIEKYKSKLNGFDNTEEYTTQFNKTLDILILMGASDVGLNTMQDVNLRWICEHNETQKRPFTFLELCQVDRMLTIFNGIEEKMPESLTELKNYFKND